MVLPPPAAHGGYHLFLSHCWQHGQDQCATLKERLRQMLSGFSIFLDVDDLTDIALLEEYIASSDVLLVFLTRDYISSKNCRRELVAAMHQDLPIVVLRESEYGKGAVTSGGLQLEFEQLLPTLSTDEVNSIRRLWKFIAPAPGCGTAGRWAGVASLGVIDWHRENHFKLSALKAVGEAAYATSVQLAAANSPNRRLLQGARLPAMQFSDQQPGALQALGKALGLDTSASSLTPAAAPAAEDSAPPGRRVRVRVRVRFGLG